MKVNKNALKKVAKAGAIQLGGIALGSLLGVISIKLIGLAWSLALALTILGGVLGYIKYNEEVENEEFDAWLKEEAIKLEAMTKRAEDAEMDELNPEPKPPIQ